MDIRRGSIRHWALFASGALAIAAIWFGLYSYSITVPSAPDPTGLTQAQADSAWYDWYRAGAWQDDATFIFAALGFLGMSGLGASLARREPDPADLAEDDEWTPEDSSVVTWGTAGRLLIAAGLVGAVAELTTMGGHQAMGIASGELADVSSLGLVTFYVDRVGTSLQFGAFGLLGLGVLASVVAARVAGGQTVWSIVGTAVGASALIVSLSRLLDDPTGLADPIMLVAGIILLPLWAIGLDRVVDGESPAPAGHAAVVAAR